MTIDHFGNCQSRAEHLRRFIDLENELSPAEMLDLWQGKDHLPDYLMAPVGKTIEMMAAGAGNARPFVRIQITPNVNLYRGPGATTEKSLLICFCGNVNRLMLPIPVFLQFIPEERFDVLIIKDPSRLGYMKGVPGFGDSLVEVVDQIRARVKLSAYVDLRCIGTSGGGSAALYAGLLLDANRAISVGGKHRSLSRAAISGESRGDEFDLMVRECRDRSATRLLLVFGALSPRDVEGAQSLLKHLPKSQPISIKPLDDHNAFVYLLAQKQLHGFFARFLFGDLPG